jgi:hypothetical protein
LKEPSSVFFLFVVIEYWECPLAPAGWKLGTVRLESGDSGGLVDEVFQSAVPLNGRNRERDATLLCRAIHMWFWPIWVCN